MHLHPRFASSPTWRLGVLKGAAAVRREEEATASSAAGRAYDEKAVDFPGTAMTSAREANHQAARAHRLEFDTDTDWMGESGAPRPEL